MLVDNIRINFRSQDLLHNTNAWYELLQKLNCLDKRLPLCYINNDEAVRYDIDSLYVKIIRSIQERSFVCISSPELAGGQHIAIAASYTKSSFYWPEIEYYNLCIYLPAYLFKSKKLFSLPYDGYFETFVSLCKILPVYKGMLHHSDINYSAVMQHVNACGNPPKYGLPVLDYPHNYKMDEFLFPTELGWIGFWNKSIVSYIGIDNIKKGSFYKISFENGGFVYQLTREPLNKKNAEHIAILKKNYFVMKRIGAQDLLNKLL